MIFVNGHSLGQDKQPPDTRMLLLLLMMMMIVMEDNEWAGVTPSKGRATTIITTMNKTHRNVLPTLVDSDQKRLLVDNVRNGAHWTGGGHLQVEAGNVLQLLPCRRVNGRRTTNCSDHSH